MLYKKFFFLKKYKNYLIDCVGLIDFDRLWENDSTIFMIIVV
jgi:hypothetical protein